MGFKYLGMVLLALISQADAWHLNVGIVGSYVKYKNEVMLLKAGAGLSKKVFPFKYVFNLSGSYGMTDTLNTENSYRATANIDYYITPKVELFTMGEWMTDRIANIQARVLAGGGVKYVFYDNESGELSISGALLYNYEHRDALKQNLARYSFRIKHKYIPNDFVQLSLIAFYQPSVTDFSNDYWIWGTFEARSKLSENLFLKLTVNDRYENLTLPRNNLSVAVGLDYRLDF